MLQSPQVSVSQQQESQQLQRVLIPQEQEFTGTQPAQEKEDTEMAAPPTLKRPSSVQGAPEGKGGRGKGKAKGFMIRVIGQKHDGLVSDDLVPVTLGMTLAQLKSVLLEPIRSEYHFEPGLYRGQREVLSEQITIQEMNMESGSKLIIFFPYPEGVEIVRPLSDTENSLSIWCANTPTSAAFIGQLEIPLHRETHSPIISVKDTVSGDIHNKK